MPVVLDPDAAAVYKAYLEAGRPAYETLTAPEARDYYMQARLISNPEPPALQSAQDITIPAPHGAIPARLYTPKSLRTRDGLAPCLVFFTWQTIWLPIQTAARWRSTITRSILLVLRMIRKIWVLCGIF